MGSSHLQFEERLRRLDQNYRVRSRGGWLRTAGGDGLYVRRVSRSRRSFPLRGAMLLLAAGFVFKGFVLSDLGEATYNQRVETLASGTPVEQIGAWVMQADPLSHWIAAQFEKI